MTAIRIQHVTKRYEGGTLALDDVSLDVAEGEMSFLPGPSGCGKNAASHPGRVPSARFG